MYCGPDPVLSAQDSTHETDTVSSQVIHSVTKETPLAQVKQQENKAGVLHCMAQSNDTGDQQLERSAGNCLEVNTSGAPSSYLAQNKCAGNVGRYYYHCHAL